jgi:cold shock CspA family protein
MTQGAIRKLIHLSAGTDLPATHLIPAANGVGYGYIGTVDGDVFFDYSALKNLRFDQLAKGMAVEYVLDQGSSQRTSDVTVIADNTSAPVNTMCLGMAQS